MTFFQKLSLYTFFSFAILPCGFMNTSAQAALYLRATPYEGGGTTVRFDKVHGSSSVNKEAKIKITSTDGKQYQVFQRIIEPVENERGVTLDMEALTSYTIRGSNFSGTLYQEQPSWLGYGDQILYTSSPGGDSDSFMVVYTISGDKVNARGQFLGKILYTVRSIDGGSEETSILTVSFDATGEFKIEIEPSSGRERVRLGIKSIEDQEGYVKFSFEESLEKPLKIYQEIERFPENEFMDEIGEECITFFTSGGTKGDLSYRNPSPLERRKVLVYSSEAERDDFIINFLINHEEIENQKAGVYRGKVNYIIEGVAFQQTVPVDLEIEINPVFTLEIIFPPEGMSFADLLPKSPPQVKEVEVRVKTNLQKPYMVIQSMNIPLTDEKGQEISTDCFTIKGEIMEGERGKVEFPVFSSVPVGDTPIFFSDEQGSPSAFKVIYMLKPYSGMSAGDYSTVVSYSLGER